MLESVLVQTDIVIVVIRVGKELVLDCKDIAGGDIIFWQKELFRFCDGHDLVTLITEVLSLLVSEVGIYIPVADNFEWFFHPYRSVISGNYHSSFSFRNLF